ncbi:MAG: S1 family peptidase [Deltaproteobacteria bacterium]|nr:S1 family peptidase [Deltaproteobacteria bacterium]
MASLRRAIVALATLTFSLSSGCALDASQGPGEQGANDGPPVSPTTSHVRPRIVGGTKAVDPSFDGIVALSITKGAGGLELCTGVLVEADLVLTAWHCVAADSTNGVDCDAASRGSAQARVGADVRPSAISVFTSSRMSAGAKAAAVGRAIVHANGDLCDADIALVALDRKLKGITPLAVRLGDSVSPGDPLDVVGFGTADDGAHGERRVRRVDVRSVGVRHDVAPVLGAREFEISRGACTGDSGGPALDPETGAVVGVVSRGLDCMGDAGAVLVRPAGHLDVLRRGLRLTGGTIRAEHGSSLTESKAAPSLGSRDDDAASCSVRGGLGGGGASGSLALVPFVLVALCRRRRAQSEQQRIVTSLRSVAGTTYDCEQGPEVADA